MSQTSTTKMAPLNSESLSPDAIYTAWAMGAQIQERPIASLDEEWRDCVPWAEWKEQGHIKKASSARDFFMTGCAKHFDHRLKPK